MPKPGSSVSLSNGFNLAYLKGMVIDPNDPFKFDFIIHQGDEQVPNDQVRSEYTKLIKYFLAALAVPDTDQWVNLSPYEKTRIITNDFGKTEMGRDLLAQDYLLKQLSSSLTNPETKLGQEFWKQVYERIYAEYGNRNVPLNTFNKIWIIPDKAVMYEKGNMVYVISCHLKVMTQEDYLALKKHGQNQKVDKNNQAITISNAVMRQIIIPAIEKEANEGKNFAPLRQVLSGMLLATWYKHALKESILTRLYANKEKLNGVDQDPRNNEMIYQRYIRAYKIGVYNFIKEDSDPKTQEAIPRKYFSGGLFNSFDTAMVNGSEPQAADNFAIERSKLLRVRVQFKNFAKLIRSALMTAPIILSTHAMDVKGAQTEPPTTGSVSLTWNKASDPTVVGYDIYRGTSSGNYTNKINIPSVNTTTVTFSNLSYGEISYFVATTYNAAGVESPPSPEVSYAVSLTPAPIVIETPGSSQQTYQTGLPQGSVVKVSSSNPSLIPTVSFNNATGILEYTTANQYGTAQIYLYLNESTTPYEILTVTENNPIPNIVISNLKPVFNNTSSYVQMDLTAYNANPTSSYPVTVSASTNLNNWHNIYNTTNSGTSPIKITIPQTKLPSQQFFKASPTTNAPISSGSAQGPSSNINNLASNSDPLLKGGIDFSQSNLDMQIKRDGKGVVLPVNQQNLASIHIDGLVPVILNIGHMESDLLFGNNMNETSPVPGRSI